MNSFSLQNEPEPYFNETEFEQRKNETLRAASDRVSENWPTVIRKTFKDAEGYDLIRDCDI